MYKWIDGNQKNCRNLVTDSIHCVDAWTWEVVQEWLDDDEANEIEAYKTQSELDQETLNKLAADKLKLKHICTEYEKGWLDHGMSNELTLSRARFESGQATVENLPMAASVGVWLMQLWGTKNDVASATGTYYAQKNYLILGNQPSYDFEEFSPLDFDFHDIADERQAFLSGQ
jgi:hypothetical protein